MAVDLSMIVPSYGSGSGDLEACLRSLMEQDTNLIYEVIVVDSSPDPTVEETVGQFPRVRLIRSQTRLFPGGARNLGVRNAAGHHLAFMDADCIASRHWVETAYRSIQTGQDITSGPVLDVQPIHLIAWVDNRCQFADFQIGRAAGQVDHVPGCNLALTKKTWARMSGFHESVLTGEDGLITTDTEGRPLEKWFNPEQIVRHQGRRTLRDFLAHQESLGYHRGWLGLFVSGKMEKMGSSPWLVWLMVPRRLGYFGLRTLQYDRAGLARFILSLPLFVIGLTAWTIGFHKGVKRNMKERT